jgi:hypothetical protein
MDYSRFYEKRDGEAKGVPGSKASNRTNETHKVEVVKTNAETFLLAVNTKIGSLAELCPGSIFLLTNLPRISRR